MVGSESSVTQQDAIAFALNESAEVVKFPMYNRRNNQRRTLTALYCYQGQSEIMRNILQLLDRKSAIRRWMFIENLVVFDAQETFLHRGKSKTAAPKGHPRSLIH